MTHLCIPLSAPAACINPLPTPVLSKQAASSKQTASKLLRARHTFPAREVWVLGPESGRKQVCSMRRGMLRCPSCWLRSRYACTRQLCCQQSLQPFCVLLKLAETSTNKCLKVSGRSPCSDLQHYSCCCQVSNSCAACLPYLLATAMSRICWSHRRKRTHLRLKLLQQPMLLRSKACKAQLGIRQQPMQWTALSPRSDTQMPLAVPLWLRKALALSSPGTNRSFLDRPILPSLSLLPPSPPVSPPPPPTSCIVSGMLQKPWSDSVCGGACGVKCMPSNPRICRQSCPHSMCQVPPLSVRLCYQICSQSEVVPSNLASEVSLCTHSKVLTSQVR